MMRLSKIIFIFLLIILLPLFGFLLGLYYGSGTDMEPSHEAPIIKSSPCSIKKSTSAHFSSTKTKDKVIIFIRGDTCDEAKLTINIVSKQGDIIYQYIGDFTKHIAYKLDKNATRDAEKFANQIISEGFKKRTSDLPNYLPKKDYYENYYNTILIDKVLYEKLQKVDKPMFYHLTFYESWQYIIYDEKKGESLVIISGGL